MNGSYEATLLRRYEVSKNEKDCAVVTSSPRNRVTKNVQDRNHA